MILDILLENKVCGKAKVEFEGLYVRFSCRCDLPEGEIYTLWLRCEDDVKLGIAVPERGEFCLRKAVAAKLLPGQMRYIQARASRQSRFVPVCEGEEFAWLSSLENARFAVRDGKAGIILP